FGIGMAHAPHGADVEAARDDTRYESRQLGRCRLRARFQLDVWHCIDSHPPRARALGARMGRPAHAREGDVDENSTPACRSVYNGREAHDSDLAAPSPGFRPRRPVLDFRNGHDAQRHRCVPALDADRVSRRSPRVPAAAGRTVSFIGNRIHMRAAQRAMEISGGIAPLALYVGVPPVLVAAWIAGSSELPPAAFLSLVGILLD